MSTPVCRPHSITARPTQAYYVPRRLLECGLSTPNGSIQENKQRSGKTGDVLRENAPRHEGKEERFQEKKRENSTSKKNQTSPRSNTKSPEVKNNNMVRQPKPTVNKPVQTSQREVTQTVSNKGTTAVSKDLKKDERKEKSEKEQRTKSSAGSSSRVSLNSPTPSLNSSAITRTRAPVFDAEAPLIIKEKENCGCICGRPSAHVVCKRCSFECSGRIQRVCSFHPTKLSLMDMRECPNILCRSIQLIELGE